MISNKILSFKFYYIVGLTALLIAFCSAFFSVFGISNLFSGAAISAMIMASSLEIGKLTATTFLYRYWKKTANFIKIYLTISVIFLTCITSAGIFGFLSAAYQKSSIEFKVTQENIVSIEGSKSYYTNQIKSSENRIKTLNDVRKIQENRLSEAQTNVFLSRNPIQLQQLQQQTSKLIDQANIDIKTENDKIDKSRLEMQSIDDKINQLKMGVANKKDIQTFKFLADALHTDLDTVAKWFIIALIVVFDPLALALLLAYNIAVFNKDENKDGIKLNISPVIPNTSSTIFIPQFSYATTPTSSTVEFPINNTSSSIITYYPIIIPESKSLNSSSYIQTTENSHSVNTSLSSSYIPTQLIKSCDNDNNNISNTSQPPVDIQTSLCSSQMNDYYKRMFKH